jgi:hypothetical protein
MGLSKGRPVVSEIPTSFIVIIIAQIVKYLNMVDSPVKGATFTIVALSLDESVA